MKNILHSGKALRHQSEFVHSCVTVGLTRVEDRTGEVGLKNNGCSLGQILFTIYKIILGLNCISIYFFNSLKVKMKN